MAGQGGCISEWLGAWQGFLQITSWLSIALHFESVAVLVAQNEVVAMSSERALQVGLFFEVNLVTEAFPKEVHSPARPNMLNHRRRMPVLPTFL